jgi:hypothetical protein
VDQEVAKTLGELELKLQELERELTSIGRRDAQAAQPQQQPQQPPGRLVDEAIEHDGAGGGPAEQHVGSPIEQAAAAEGNAFGGPGVFGGEEVPAQAGATSEGDWTVEVRETAYGEIPTTTPTQPAPTSGAIPGPPIPGPPITPPEPTPQPPPTTPPGQPPPTTPPGPPPPQSPPGTPAAPALLDLAALVDFREKLASTMGGLIDEYSRLLSVDPSSRREPGA